MKGAHVEGMLIATLAWVMYDNGIAKKYFKTQSSTVLLAGFASHTIDGFLASATMSHKGSRDKIWLTGMLITAVVNTQRWFFRICVELRESYKGLWYCHLN